MDQYQSSQEDEFERDSEEYEDVEDMHKKKRRYVEEQIELMEKCLNDWINQQRQIKQDQNIEDKQDQVNRYLSGLKTKILENQLYESITKQQIKDFFYEARIQLMNKKKLNDEIDKLKLLQLYPANQQKRTYPKDVNIILKTWLLDNYKNPYPTKEEVDILEEQTKLEQKQILNWFINARNNMKNRNMNDKNFRKQVTQRYKELLIQKKIKSNQQS